MPASYIIRTLWSVLLLTCIIPVQSQESITTTGADVSGLGGSASYVVGQIAYESISGSNGYSTQGVQQPFEIFVTHGEDVAGLELEVNVFPNPATNYLVISFDEYENQRLNYTLHDVQGRLVESDLINGQQTTVGVESLLSSIYFLTIYSGDELIKSFKIIKNQN